MTKGLDRTLCDAAWVGDIVCVNAIVRDPLALANADPTTALLHAAHRGHPAAVLLLLPHANALARDSEALWRAAPYGRMRCIDLLVPVCAPEAWKQWQWDDLPAAGRERVLQRMRKLGRC